jgi:hypothetical protein
MSAPAVVVQGMARTFGTGEAAVPALVGVDLVMAMARPGLAEPAFPAL